VISRPTEIIKNYYPPYKNVEGEVQGTDYPISDWLKEATIDWKLKDTE
jgi:hypothetical protein